MTIRELIEQLNTLAADPASGVTLDSEVRTSSLSGDERIRRAFVWPQRTGNYVTFAGDDTTDEEIERDVREHRAAMDERDRLESVLASVDWDYPAAAAKLGMAMEEFNRAVRKVGL